MRSTLRGAGSRRGGLAALGRLCAAVAARPGRPAGGPRRSAAPRGLPSRSRSRVASACWPTPLRRSRSALSPIGLAVATLPVVVRMPSVFRRTRGCSRARATRRSPTRSPASATAALVDLSGARGGRASARSRCSVRPRRLQGLQRHLRPPRRRRAARALGRAARGGRAATAAPTARRRRVLRARGCAERDASRDRAAATTRSRGRRGLPGRELVRRVLLPAEAPTAAGALQLADRRMYAQKEGRPPRPARQSGDVLLRVLGEREPELREHLATARLARRGRGRELGSRRRAARRRRPRRRAARHRQGRRPRRDPLQARPARRRGWAFIRNTP